MNLSIRRGFSFGLTSGIITTLGLIVGLRSGTHSSLVVISGILVIAIADALSDALGIHVSEEFENKHSTKEVWEATVFTFLSKFIFALSFAVPFLFLQLSTAIIVCVIWGLGLIAVFSYYIAKLQGAKPYKLIFEHLVIVVVVIIITNYVGKLVQNFS